jgi:hypothetical protein
MDEVVPRKIVEVAIPASQQETLVASTSFAGWSPFNYDILWTKRPLRPEAVSDFEQPGIEGESRPHFTRSRRETIKPLLARPRHRRAAL